MFVTEFAESGISCVVLVFTLHEDCSCTGPSFAERAAVSCENFAFRRVGPEVAEKTLRLGPPLGPRSNTGIFLILS